MASGSNNNRGRARQLNLNEVFGGRVSSQPSFQSSQQTPGFEHEIFSLNMDNESESQSDDDVGNDVIREPAHVIPNQQRYRRVFKASWKIGRPWLLHYRPNDGPATGFMKCAVCQEMCVESRWGTGIGCKSLQKSAVKVHEKSVDHKHSVARWEAIHFPQRANAPPVIQGLNVMVDREQSRIITVMKVLYFTVWNDRSILTYKDTCQLLSLLQTPNMSVNDEYGSYTSRYAALEFLWRISKYLSNGLLSKAQSSPFLL